MSNEKSDYSYILTVAIANVMTDPESSDKTKEMRGKALKQIFARLNFYKARGFMDYLLNNIAEKKSVMIMEATSKTEIEKIVKLAPPRYDGAKFCPAEYSVPEEELICWSETSLHAPLNEEGFKRYQELFKQIFPESDVFK